MGRHGKKRWIRDWRGRIKRSTDRTQRDWLGVFAGRSSRRRALYNEYPRFVLVKKRERECPQCRYLNKLQPPLAWDVQRLHSTIKLRPFESLWNHPTYKTLRAQYRFRVDFRVRTVISGTLTETVDVWVRERWDRRPHSWEADPKLVTKVSYPRLECEPCRRKHDVAYYRHYSGAPITGYSRTFKTWRKLEEAYRRAELRGLLRQARTDPDVWDEIPTTVHRMWLD